MKINHKNQQQKTNNSIDMENLSIDEIRDKINEHVIVSSHKILHHKQVILCKMVTFQNQKIQCNI